MFGQPGVERPVSELRVSSEFTNVKQSNKGEGGRSRGGGAQNNISGQFPAPVTTPGREVEMLKIGNGDINQLLTIIHG